MKLCLLYIPLLVFLLFERVGCNTFYGKLVLKISVATKKTNVFAHKPTVFATRRSTYMKKDGDVFQIHIPGIAKNSTKDSISFESVRFPGYFLRHKKFSNDYRFRIAKPMTDDAEFDKEATFLIQRHSGIEGSGMLRLYDDPAYYLCVRKYNYADSALKAMKNDNTEDFRARCSFFIQKLKPETVGDEVRKSTESIDKKTVGNTPVINNIAVNQKLDQVKPVSSVKPANINQPKPDLSKKPVNQLKSNSQPKPLRVKPITAGKPVKPNQPKITPGKLKKPVYPTFKAALNKNVQNTKLKNNQKPVVNTKLNAIKPQANKPLIKASRPVLPQKTNIKTKKLNNNNKLSALKTSSSIHEGQVHSAYAPSESVIHKMLNDYVKKIETESKNFFENHLNTLSEPNGKPPASVANIANVKNNENPTAKTWIGYNGGNIAQNQNSPQYYTNPYESMTSNMYPMQTSYNGDNFNSAIPNTLSYFPVVSRYDPTKTYIRAFFQENDDEIEKLVNPEKSKPLEVGTEQAPWRNEIRPDSKSKVTNAVNNIKPKAKIQQSTSKTKPGVKPHNSAHPITPSTHMEKPVSYSHGNESHQILKDTKESRQRHQEPSLNIDGQKSEVSISATRSSMKKKSHRVYHKQNNHIGPDKPITSADFSRKTHREPSLNLDGLMHKVSVPHTRSNISGYNATNIGPEKPISSKDFGKQTHREPSLNLDGFMHKVHVPGTRSNVSTTNKTNGNKATKSSGIILSGEAKVSEITDGNTVTDAALMASKDPSLLDLKQVPQSSSKENMGSKKGSIERTNFTTANAVVKSVFENPSPHDKESPEGKTKIVTHPEQESKTTTASASKKEMLIDETLKNFTGDADVDFKLFSEEKSPSNNDTSSNIDSDFLKDETKDLKTGEEKNNNATTTNSKSNTTTSAGAAAAVEPKETVTTDSKPSNNTAVGQIVKAAFGGGDPKLHNMTVAKYIEGNKTVVQHEEVFTDEKGIEGKDDITNTHLTNGTVNKDLTVFDGPNSSPENSTKTVVENHVQEKTDQALLPGKNDTKPSAIGGEKNATAHDNSTVIMSLFNVTSLSSNDTTSEFYPNITTNNSDAASPTPKRSSNTKPPGNPHPLLGNNTEHFLPKNASKDHEKGLENATTSANILPVNQTITSQRNGTNHTVADAYTDIKEVEQNKDESEQSNHFVSNGEGTSHSTSSEGGHEVSAENNNDSSDNIPFDVSTTADGGETGDNLDVGNDDSHTSLANLLGQGDNGIEYDNIDKATTFKDLGSSEMKGIASAMSKLNAQDVTHLKSNMKTIDLLDRNAPNRFGHLSKVSSGFENGLHTNGVNFAEGNNGGNDAPVNANEPSISVGQIQNSVTLEGANDEAATHNPVTAEHMSAQGEASVQPESAESHGVGAGVSNFADNGNNEELSHLDGNNDLTGATSENTGLDQGNTLSMEGATHDNGIASDGLHEAHMTPELNHETQDQNVQDASSVPVEVSAASPDPSTNAQESIENAHQQLGLTQTPELGIAQQQNSEDSTVGEPQVTSLHSAGIHDGGGHHEYQLNGDNSAPQEELSETGNPAQRSDDSSELAAKLQEDNEEGNVALIKEKLHEIDEQEGQQEVDNLNEATTLTTQPEVNDNNLQRTIKGRKAHLKKKTVSLRKPGRAQAHIKQRVMKPKANTQNTVVKGVAKNTILRVPIAISYTKVPREEIGATDHNVEHILHDVIHDVKNELHGGALPIGKITTIKHQAKIFPLHTLATNEILPHRSEAAEPEDIEEDDSRPLVGSPTEHHPVSVFEDEKFKPTKCVNCEDDVDELRDIRPEIQHEVNVVRHTHHVVTVKDEHDKEKMVNGLVNFDTDRCVSLQLINNIGDRYRLISSINKHGYTPRGKVFTLKTVFKDPAAHKYVSFHAIDEREPNRQVTLDGAKELISVPTPCKAPPKQIVVASPEPSTFRAPQAANEIHMKKLKKTLIMPAENEDELTDTDDDANIDGYENEERDNAADISKKNTIAFPSDYAVTKVHPRNHKRQKITHIYLRKKSKKDRIESYPSQYEQFQNIRNSDSDTFFGKLVLKISPLSSRGSIERPFVFATRRSTYLKKDGDIFKIHTPGLAYGGGRDSISFESVRWPGYFLKHRVEENDVKFRIAKASPSNYRIFDKESTFIVEKHNGIEGSGMLRLFDKPNWYMCVRKHDISASALKAMKNDHSPGFRKRCSFFIEKLEPAAVVGEMMKYTDNNHNNGYSWSGGLSKRKLIHRPVYQIRALLEQFLNRGKLDLMRDRMLKGANVQPENQPVRLVNNYMQGQQQTPQAADHRNFWSNPSNDNSMMYVQSNTPMQIVGRAPVVKTGISRLSDKISQLSGPSIQSFSKYPQNYLNIPPSPYMLYRNEDLGQSEKFFMKQKNPQSKPFEYHDDDEGVGRREKKTEIFKASNTEKTKSKNKTLVDDDQAASLFGNSIIEKTEFFENPLNSTDQTLKFVDDSIKEDLKNLDEDHTSTKKLDDIFSSTRLLSARSQPARLVNDSIVDLPKEEHYVKDKHVKNKFYGNDDEDQKYQKFSDDFTFTTKEEPINHVYTDASGKIVSSTSSKNPEQETEGISQKKSDEPESSESVPNDGLDVDSSTSSQSLGAVSATDNGAVSSSSDSNSQSTDDEIQHLYTDEKGNVKVMEPDGTTKSLSNKDANTDQKQNIANAEDSGESRNLKVQHLFADSSGHIAGVTPKENSILGKLTSPGESLTELRKLGKKVRLGVHCKRSAAGTIDVAECSDESEFEGGQGIMEEDLKSNHASSLPDNEGQKELKMVGLDLSHVSQTNSSDQEALESMEDEGLGHHKSGFHGEEEEHPHRSGFHSEGGGDEHPHHFEDEHMHHLQHHHDDHDDDDEHHGGHHGDDEEEEDEGHHGGGGGEHHGTDTHYEDSDNTENDDHHEGGHGHGNEDDDGDEDEEDDDEDGSEHDPDEHEDGEDDEGHHHKHHHHHHHGFHHGHHHGGHHEHHGLADYPGHHWKDSSGEEHVYDGEKWENEDEDTKKKEGNSKVEASSGTKAAAAAPTTENNNTTTSTNTTTTMNGTAVTENKNPSTALNVTKADVNPSSTNVTKVTSDISANNAKSATQLLKANSTLKELGKTSATETTTTNAHDDGSKKSEPETSYTNTSIPGTSNQSNNSDDYSKYSNWHNDTKGEWQHGAGNPNEDWQQNGFSNNSNTGSMDDGSFDGSSHGMSNETNGGGAMGMMENNTESTGGGMMENNGGGDHGEMENNNMMENSSSGGNMMGNNSEPFEHNGGMMNDSQGEGMNNFANESSNSNGYDMNNNTMNNNDYGGAEGSNVHGDNSMNFSNASAIESEEKAAMNQNTGMMMTSQNNHTSVGSALTEAAKFNTTSNNKTIEAGLTTNKTIAKALTDTTAHVTKETSKIKENKVIIQNVQKPTEKVRAKLVDDSLHKINTSFHHLPTAPITNISMKEHSHTEHAHTIEPIKEHNHVGGLKEHSKAIESVPTRPIVVHKVEQLHQVKPIKNDSTSATHNNNKTVGNVMNSISHALKAMPKDVQTKHLVGGNTPAISNKDTTKPKVESSPNVVAAKPLNLAKQEVKPARISPLVTEQGPVTKVDERIGSSLKTPEKPRSALTQSTGKGMVPVKTVEKIRQPAPAVPAASMEKKPSPETYYKNAAEKLGMSRLQLPKPIKKPLEATKITQKPIAESDVVKKPEIVTSNFKKIFPKENAKGNIKLISPIRQQPKVDETTKKHDSPLQMLKRPNLISEMEKKPLEPRENTLMKPTEQITLKKKSSAYLNESEEVEANKIVRFRNHKTMTKEFEDRFKSSASAEKFESIPRSKDEPTGKTRSELPENKNGKSKTVNKYVLRLQELKKERELKKKTETERLEKNETTTEKHNEEILKKHDQSNDENLKKHDQSNDENLKKHDQSNEETLKKHEQSKEETLKKHDQSNDETLKKHDQSNEETLKKHDESDEIQKTFEKIPDSDSSKNETIQTTLKNNQHEGEGKPTEETQDLHDIAAVNSHGNIVVNKDEAEVNKTLDTTMLEEEKDFVENALENHVGNTTMLKDELKDLDKDENREFEGSGEEIDERRFHSNKEAKIKEKEKTNEQGKHDQEKTKSSEEKETKKMHSDNKIKNENNKVTDDSDEKEKGIKDKTNKMNPNESGKIITEEKGIKAKTSQDDQKEDRKNKEIKEQKSQGSDDEAKLELVHPKTDKTLKETTVKPSAKHDTANYPNQNQQQQPQQQQQQQQNTGGQTNNQQQQNNNDPFRAETVNDVYLFRNKSYNPALEGLKGNSSKKKDSKSKHFHTALEDTTQSYHDKNIDEEKDNSKNSDGIKSLKSQETSSSKSSTFTQEEKSTSIDQTSAKSKNERLKKEKHIATEDDQPKMKKVSDSKSKESEDSLDFKSDMSKEAKLSKSEGSHEDETSKLKEKEKEKDSEQKEHALALQNHKELADKIKKEFNTKTENVFANKTKSVESKKINKSLKKEKAKSFQETEDLDYKDGDQIHLQNVLLAEESRMKDGNKNKTISIQKFHSADHETSNIKDDSKNTTKISSREEKSNPNQENKEKNDPNKNHNLNRKKQNKKGKTKHVLDLETIDNNSLEELDNFEGLDSFSGLEDNDVSGKHDKDDNQPKPEEDNPKDKLDRKITDEKKKAREEKTEKNRDGKEQEKSNKGKSKETLNDSKEEFSDTKEVSTTDESNEKHENENTAFDSSNSISPSLSVRNESSSRKPKLETKDSTTTKNSSNKEHKMKEFNKLLDDVLSIKQRAQKTQKEGENKKEVTESKPEKQEDQKKNNNEKTSAPQKQNNETVADKDNARVSASKQTKTTGNTNEDEDSGETLTGIAKAMAEIMAKNADKISDGGIEDLENLDKSTQSILNESDQEEEHTNKVTKNTDKKIASTDEPYFVPDSGTKYDSTGDNSNLDDTDKSNTTESNSLHVTQTNKLHVKVPTSYTRPSLMNVKATENEKLKDHKSLEDKANNSTNDKTVVSSFSKQTTDSNSDSNKEADLIHEFKQLFNIADIGDSDGKTNLKSDDTKDEDNNTEEDEDKQHHHKAVKKEKENSAVVAPKKEEKQHQHRIVTVKDEAEKERMVNGLVADVDRCVSLQFINELGNRFKLVSSINNHGYTPRGKIFTLKQVFKDPRSHRSVSFHAYDELDNNRTVLLNGAQELVCVPVSCKYKPHKIDVTSRQPSKGNVFKKDNVQYQKMRGFFETENEQAICPSSCTEYCASSCPAYCCSAPIPGGLGSSLRDSPETYESDNISRNFLPSGRNDIYPQRYVTRPQALDDGDNEDRDEMEDEEVANDDGDKQSDRAYYNTW